MTAGLFAPLALGTNLYMGHPLDFALAQVKKAGFAVAEIASIVGNCIHVTPAEMTDEKAGEVRGLLQANGLTTYAFSGHADLTDDVQYADFQVKMRFAKAIGAKVINTNSGPVGRRAVFLRNMPKIIDLAEKLDLVVCLESHGDIVDTAKSAVEVMKVFNHPLVRLNYDTGNTYYYAKGRINIAEDLKYGLPYLAHLHLKDIHIEGDRVWYRPIGKGDIDFAAVFDVVAGLGRAIPCGLEIPVFVEGTLAALTPEKAPLSLEAADRAIRESLETINGCRRGDGGRTSEKGG